MALAMNTPIGVLSYPNLFKPRSIKQQDGSMGVPRYGCAIILEPSKIAKLKAAIIEVARERWGEKAEKGLEMGKLHYPIRNGDEKDDEPYQGKLFLTANGNDKPGLVNAAGAAITDEGVIYAGLLVRLNVSFFIFENPMKKGVGCGLNHVQVVAPGPRIDGRKSASDAFDDDEDFSGYDTAGTGAGVSDHDFD